MPWKTTLKRAKKDRAEGKTPTTQAGEFVREEMEHIRRGKHGARNTKQAIAIGLSKARRAGVKLAAPKPGTTSSRTRKQAQRDLAKAAHGQRKTSHKRSVARERALKREPHSRLLTVRYRSRRGAPPHDGVVRRAVPRQRKPLPLGSIAALLRFSARRTDARPRAGFLLFQRQCGEKAKNPAEGGRRSLGYGGRTPSP
jgi:hypothetical protein